QKHSPRSLGTYKYCVYQIVVWPQFSQLCAQVGPVFVMPIIGAYHYIDFTDDPAVVHGVLCAWVLISAFDVESILDGFNFRLRVLLTPFYPRFANKTFWIVDILNAKVMAVLLVGVWIAPVGSHLNRDDMRIYLVEHYPNVVPTFDAYKSFIVYDLEQVSGEYFLLFNKNLVSTCMFSCELCKIYLKKLNRILHQHRNQMSISTKRMHTRFLHQLSLQATVPFIVLICPLCLMLALILVEFQFENNLTGYIILSSLMFHCPLTSIMTIVLYEPYRKVI
ncbi:hypothetical protein PENTCL1PPCAC_16598, partial [Pristionchus entomophagus]